MRGRWLLRDRPGVLWLLLAHLVSLGHPFVPESRWLMVHLVLLGALTHSVMVWSTHFTNALLKGSPEVDDRRTQSRRLWTLLVGTACVLVGVPTTWWWLTVLGATAVSVAVLDHGRQLGLRLRAALPGRFRTTVHHYLAAACCLPVGAALGATLALGLDDRWHGRVLLAHTMVNLLGWVGLTVTGTLLTLWPTMLRTRMSPGAEARARQALPVFATALVVLVAGALGGWQPLAGIGLALYGLALVWWASGVLTVVRQAPPREFAPASVGAALVWWCGGLVILLVTVATAPGWEEVAARFDLVTPVLAVGFAAQLLTGALSYLMPVVIGGGPRVARAAGDWFNRGAAFRLVTTNLGLLICLLPVPSLVRVLVSVLVLASLAAFVPLMFRAVRAAGRVRREQVAPRAEGSGERPGTVAASGEQTSSPAPRGPATRPTIWSAGRVAAALSTLALAVALAGSATPLLGGGTPADTGAEQVEATGHTEKVTVEARDMHFTPSTLEIEAGDRVVLEVVNADDQAHDLQIAGQQTPRLAPGERATLDLGVIGTEQEGWCTLVGHRQMGMTFSIDVTDPSTPGSGKGSSAEPSRAKVTPDPEATVAEPADPRAPRPPKGDTHEVTLRASELELEVGPGITQQRWTFNDRAPGPTLRGKVGDTFVVTLVNDGSMGHSIDFHAGALAPDRPMRTIGPGESLEYRFTATRAGIWMYHCSTPPMSTHIAAGMHGAVIIEPEGGLPEVDREYVMVQSEVYQAEDGGLTDASAVQAEDPALVTFNGVADQYVQHPLTATVGERVRFWVLNAGPNRPSSFHVIGGQFDTVWFEGGYQLGPRAEGTGSQALGLQPAQGGFVELTFPEAGRYPFVSHVMVDAERGARGVVEVTERDAPGQDVR
ncbi:nitrite reductase (NO-forming) [Kytococcus aerolatus]|uniref:Copper-containing nitrite reductase n=1 Tax=Kytococcus aerolatus TaxID=592308 RepID=A0A212T2W3_9MICO|nr:multicopper oxidase domain-containing protein [Kytococcus aerolatus]SNC60114.1 nitrite reductase (NO-forming) [Kytococcus aerolatus]